MKPGRGAIHALQQCSRIRGRICNYVHIRSSDQHAVNASAITTEPTKKLARSDVRKAAISTISSAAQRYRWARLFAGTWF
jgi:hypothetical protein